MIDERTGGRGYPLPHLDNTLEQDLPRIRQSLGMVDQDVVRAGQDFQRLTRQLRMKDLLGISFT